MNVAAVISLVRHVLTTIGGVLIAKGMVDESQVNEIVGGLSVLAGVIWGYHNSQRSRKIPNQQQEGTTQP